MAMPRLGWVNRIDTATLTGGGADTAHPITNLTDPALVRFYRTAGQVGWLQADFGAGVTIDALALMDTSLSTSATMRVQLGLNSRTNLCLRSQELDISTWGKTNATIVANAATAPNGTVTADKIAASTTTNTFHQAQQSFSSLADSTDLVCSAYVQAADVTWAFLNFFDKAGVNHNFHVDIVNGVTGNRGSIAADHVGVTAIGNGWFRIWLAVNTSSGAATPAFSIRPALGNGQQQWAANIGDGIYAWGAQVETDTGTHVPTPYIATTTAAASSSLGDVYDTGIVYVSAGADPRFNGNVLWLPPSSLTARYLRIDLADLTVDNIDVARAFAGALRTWGRAAGYGGSIGYQELGSVERMPAGTVLAKATVRPRVLTLPWNFMAETDFLAGSLEIDRVCGAAKDVLAIRDPGSAYLAQNWVWGVPTAPQLGAQPSTGIWTRTLTVEERL